MQGRANRIINDSNMHGVNTALKHCLGPVRADTRNEIRAALRGEGGQCRTKSAAISHFHRDRRGLKISGLDLNSYVPPGKWACRFEGTNWINHYIQSIVCGGHRVRHYTCSCLTSS